jgi:hypothetical protein
MGQRVDLDRLGPGVKGGLTFEGMSRRLCELDDGVKEGSRALDILVGAAERQEKLLGGIGGTLLELVELMGEVLLELQRARTEGVAESKRLRAEVERRNAQVRDGAGV